MCWFWLFLGLFFVCFWFPSCILPVYPLGSFFWILMHLLIYLKKKIASLTLMKDSERLDLLKEIGGTRVYEERRRESLKIMQETGRSLFGFCFFYITYVCCKCIFYFI